MRGLVALDFFFLERGQEPPSPSHLGAVGPRSQADNEREGWNPSPIWERRRRRCIQGPQEK